MAVVLIQSSSEQHYRHVDRISYVRLWITGCAGGITTELSASFRRKARTTSTTLVIAVIIRTASVTINHGPRSGNVNKNSPHELNIIGTLSKSTTGRISSQMSRNPTRNSRCPRRCPNFRFQCGKRSTDTSTSIEINRTTLSMMK